MTSSGLLPYVAAPDRLLYEQIAEFTGNKEAGQMVSDVFVRIAEEAGLIVDRAEDSIKVNPSSHPPHRHQHHYRHLATITST
jgi:hypothetical protein